MLKKLTALAAAIARLSLMALAAWIARCVSGASGGNLPNHSAVCVDGFAGVLAALYLALPLIVYLSRAAAPSSQAPWSASCWLFCWALWACSDWASACPSLLTA